MLEFMEEGLADIAKDFYTATGVMVVLYDDHKKALFSYPHQNMPFCAAVRQCPSLLENCLQSDSRGFAVCEETRRPYIYKCHMGLTEAIAPICEEDVIIGYMMIGQILGETDRHTAEEQIRRVCALYKMDAAALQGKLDACKTFTEDAIRAVLNMLSMCICYLHVHRIVKAGQEDTAAALKQYADTHFREDIPLEKLCRSMYISRGTLYNLSKKAFGMGLADYIRKKRIGEAKKLLRTTDETISVIARRVGYQDNNYFARAFKREENMTPSEYRRRGAEE